ncbi:MAG TPA: creatininase family protein [Mesorhizobium sp.]|jgi:creatinine amidohydrolase|uniref:creatininase family protein n=1 Tax=Mesorhizobium sp. TaxID=1871066 RepID=UPI002DDD9349|nr:creatininase family protein [Mesorhizobium sp.]HEV2505076.1 creatininase family protein [Mesorhizobium sp.]
MTRRALRWADLSRPDFAALDRARAICVLPVGAIEQHGPHLPVSVDRDLAEAVLEWTLAKMDEGPSILALPGFCYGKSNEHGAIAGTLSLSAATLLAILGDLAHSLANTGFRRLVLLNAHGGNAPVLDIAARDLKIAHGLRITTCHWYNFNEAELHGDTRESAFGIHAGLIETSAMLALKPGLVAMDRADDFANQAETWQHDYTHIGLSPGRARPAWTIEDLSASGACGNAAAATPEIGEQLLETAASNFARFLGEFERFCDQQDQRDRAH